MTPLETFSDAYERERAMWNLRRDKMSGMWQVVRLELTEPPEDNPAILCELDDKDAADNIMRRTRRHAAGQAGLLALAKAKLPGPMISAASEAADRAVMTNAGEFLEIVFSSMLTAAAQGDDE